MHASSTRAPSQEHLLEATPAATGHSPALPLLRGAMWSAVPGRGGLCLRSAAGLLWVTVAGDAQDYMLSAGEQLCLPAGRKAVAQALADSILHVG